MQEQATSARYAASLTATACLVLTVILAANPGLVPVYQNRALHVALETVAALVLLLVAIVLAGRYSRSASGRDLFALVAVSVLAANNLLLSVVGAIVTEKATDFSTWTSHGASAVGAVLLAMAALAPSTPLRRPRRTALLTVFGTMTVMAGIGVFAAVLGAELPGQFSSPPTDRESLERFQQQPTLTAIESFAAFCYAVAGAAIAHNADRERDPFQMWLSIFAVMASVAFLNYALFPTLYTELLYAGDILLLAADLALVVGATRELALYQEAVTQAAVLEERRRFGRDLHDGVAQELAFIASQIRWSARRPPEERDLSQILDAVERALDESRGAIAALSRPVDEPLKLALTHTAEEVAERLGGTLEIQLDDRVELSLQWREALTRIVREAVANAIRHGRASTVSISLHDNDGVWLRVSDDGNGFDAAEPRSATSFGLISMKERAESLGGQFRLLSAPGKGTSVEIHIPDARSRT